MKNWKTTVIGVGTAIFIAVKPYILTGQIDWGQLLMAAGVAALGYFAKDAGVTGTAK